MSAGWIKLHRKILKWDRYNEHITKDLWIHLLLNANIEPKKWRGIVIERGQFATSISKLSAELEFSISEIRTALKKLEIGGEISRKIAQKSTIIKIMKYEEYQAVGVGVQKFGNDDFDKINTRKSQSKNNSIATTREREEEKNLKNQEEKNLLQQEERMLDVLILPTDWEDFAKSVGCFYAKAEFFKFREYWLSDKPKNRMKTDWFKTWRNWIKREMGVFKSEIKTEPANPYEDMTTEQILEARGIKL